jgi:hypothetical protein
MSADNFEPPDRGLILWPVGTGDSTTVIVDDGHWAQIDLHQLAASGNEDDDRVPVVDRLIELAPQRDGKPYVAAFAATHLDKDHILGFAKLLEEALIGELWFSPRVLHDNEDGEDLCDDADVFVEEVRRRINHIAAGNEAQSGDRILIVGDDDLLSESPYSELPAECFTKPGEFFSSLDGESLEDTFRVYVHSPENGDEQDNRNDLSLGIQIMISDGEYRGTFLTLGDLEYQQVIDVFERADDDDLLWSVFQAPHHCSKKVMYVDEDGAEVLKTDVMDRIEETADARGAWIVASCECIPAQDEPGANPPHRKAATAFEERVDSGRFVVTGDYAPAPLVFELTADGLRFREDDDVTASTAKTPTEAAAAAGGGSTGHSSAVGFGGVS